jgi:2-polyprenyl-3-methyl-5-hydroxy-6-metoxy-1,4-benzoquinol methylase
MRIATFICPVKFKLARTKLKNSKPRILDIGCGNNSPSTTKKWFGGCFYAGADIQEYNLNQADIDAMDVFYNLGWDGSGYDQIPDETFDFVIMNHVIEHMPSALDTLGTICQKLKPGGFIWIAFPSERSLSLPSAEGTLQFCDDPTHVWLPCVREVSNALLSKRVRVLHAGRSRDLPRAGIGVVMLPIAFLKRALTGSMSCKGLWYILGFEDHVFGQKL